MKDKKILVVDFDEESLISLSNLVFEEGFQAVTAMDGLSAYEKFKTEDFDLVMIEPMLPKLHGFELMKKINQDPAKKVPIIVITGIYREPSCKMEALQVYGASAYFTKPWNKDELRSRMLNLLVNGLKQNAPEPEPRPKKQESQPPPLRRTPPTPDVDEWGLLKPQSPAPEIKPRKGIEDIEKELRAAVSGMAVPARKKEPTGEAIKERKDTKAGVDGDIDALLKNAIGGLGLGKKKKRPEPVVRPAAVPKPEPPPEKPEKKERIPIPHPSIRPSLPTEKKAFGIDQTLLEIDKIPLDLEKHVAERAKPALERVAPPQKRAYFDEFGETEKKKPPVALISGIAAAALVLAGSTFMIIKPKKPKEMPAEMVSSVQPSLPSEFAFRKEEIRTPSATRQNESTPDPKKVLAKLREQRESSEISAPIPPVIPAESPPIALELQLPQTSEFESRTPEQAAQTQTENSTLNQEPSPTGLPPQEPSSAPADEKPSPGELVPLNEVSIPPVLIKRIDPKYPSQAFSLGVSGTVTVNALISETGDVVRTEILKGIKGGYGFEKAAETAVKQWKYRPAMKKGVPVRVWKAIDINFKLSQAPAS